MIEGAAGQLFDWFRTWGDLTPTTGLALAAIFIVASLGLPRVLLSISAGAAFGLGSLLIVQPSTTIGAVVAFLAARYLIADRVRRRIDTRPVLQAIAGAIDSEGWRIVALIRLASPVPSSLSNYVFGITRIGLAPYTIATLICTLPQNFLYIYLGATGRAMLLEETLSPLQLGLMLARKTRLALQRLNATR
jgi:uncharacterized membrane protein YdjX (TVP38/TMEM64 family)